MSNVETRETVITPFTDVKSKRQRWLWNDRIPLGVVTTFSGHGGEGKSTFALHIAAQLTRGEIDGDLLNDPRPVLIVSHEDDLSTIVKPRLIAAGADIRMVYHLTIRSKVNEVTTETVPALPEDIALIREAIKETGAGLVIIDPITSTIGGDLNSLSDVRAALNPLAIIAQEADIAIIAIMHLNKGGGSLSARISGSHGFHDVPRSSLVFATDNDTGNRVVTFNKGNYSQAQATSFEFALRSVAIPTDDGDTTHVAAVEYLGETDRDVLSILDRDRDGSDSQERSEAEQWLTTYLEDRNGTAPASDIQKAARSDGFSVNRIKRASVRLNVVKAKSSFDGPWMWSLKGIDEPKNAKGSPPDPLVPFGLLGDSGDPLAGDDALVDAPIGVSQHPGETIHSDPGYCETCGMTLPNHTSTCKTRKAG